MDAKNDQREALIDRVAPLLHAGDRLAAAKVIAEFAGAPAPTGSETALEFCFSLLHWCLNNGHYDWAARLLWSEEVFTCRPRATRLIWDEVQRCNSLLLMGAASMSKSYSMGAWLLLDWVRDPEFTSVYLVGPTEEHLKDNLFSHIVTMHSQASLPLPGKVTDLFIGLDRHRRKGAIRGVVIPQGSTRAGRLQGRKRIPRPSPHPQFGALSRIRFFLDELEKIPVGIWRDIDNVFSNLDADVEGFKLVGAFNPEDITGPVAVRCEPPQGWEAFNPETDEVWTSKRGWRVVRLDAAKCENVVTGKVIFPGMQTKEGFDRIINNAGGQNTPGYWSMARACFPPAGTVYSIIPATLLYRARGTFLWVEPPVLCAGVDLALEGRDQAVMALGRFGRASGWRAQPSFDCPQGREELFTDTTGRREIRWAAQLDQIVELPRGDTVKMAEVLRNEAVRLGIQPGWMLLDRTGNGAGVHDLLRNIWSSEVRGLNLTEGATEQKILAEDTKTPKEEYGRVVNEVWFAVRKWLEFGFFRIAEGALTEELVKELSGRRYAPDRHSRVETKLEYRNRGNPSPHRADAVTYLLHCIRVASGCVPSALGGTGAVVDVSDESPHLDFVVDAVNRFEDLDSESVGAGL